MEITTYYITCKPAAGYADLRALVDGINDAGAGNGDNRCWNTLRSQLDALFDAEMQQRLGIAIEAEHREATDDD